MGTNHASNQWLTYSGQAANDWSGGIDFFSNGDIATAYSVARSNGASTVVVQRLSKDGVVLWSKEINADYAPGVGSVLVGNDNSIYIVGGTKTGISGESGKNDSDVFAAALSGTGQTLWYRNYGIGIHEIGASAVLDGNGNIILNGRVSEVNDAYTFIKDVPNFYGAEFSSGWRGFQLKINPIDGEVIKAYTTGSFNSGGELIAVDQLRNTVFVGGYTFGAVNGVQTIGNGDPAGANKYLIARNETNGTVLWTRMENWIRSNIVAQSSEDAIYFVDKGVVEKVKGSTGQTIWSKSIANTDYVLSPISGGGILISESNSNGTLAIRRWDGDGNEIKTQIITHTGTLSPRSFVEMGDGNLIISGTVSGEVSLTDNIVKIINNGGGSEGFVMQVKSAFSEYPPSTNNNYITPFGNALYFVSYENAVSIDSAQKVNSPYTGREEYGFAYASIIGSEATVTGEGGWSRRKLIQTLDVSESVSSGLIYLDFKPISANGKPNARIRFNYKVVGDSSEGKHVITEGTIDSVVGLNGDHHMWWHGHWTSTENDIKIESSYDLTHITNLQLEIQFYNVTAEGSEYFTFDTGFRVRSGNFEWDASSLSNSFSDNLPMSSSPIIRGNSLYTIVDGPSWTEAEANSVKLGGHLVTINDASENLWIVDYYRQTGISLSPDSRGVRNIFIGLTRNEGTGTKYGNPAGKWDGWISGESSSYRPEYWGIGEGMDPDGYFSALVWGEGTWNDFPEWQHQGVGLAEIPFIRRGDSAYVIVQGPTWEEAEANANKLGGHLVTINDAEENEWLAKSFGLRDDTTPWNHNDPEDIYFWIGLHDIDYDKNYQWSSGEPLEFTNWQPSYPQIRDDLYIPYVEIGYTADGKWNNNGYGEFHSALLGIAEIKLAPNNTPTGSPTLSGNLKVGSTITIDASSIQDADNHEYWTPVYQYYWEVSADGGIWTRLTSADATDNDENYTLTSAEVGKQLRGVVSYLDGYGTNEILATEVGEININDNVITDSVRDFSSTQGGNNWYYGYYEGILSPSGFIQINTYRDDMQSWVLDWNTYYTYVRADGGHPHGPISTKPTNVEHWSVRRWISNVEGIIRLTGIINDMNRGGGGDGITGRIFVDGIEVYSATVSNQDPIEGIDYAVEVNVEIGSVVDFAIDPNSWDGDDDGMFTATIELVSENIDLGLELPWQQIFSSYTPIRFQRGQDITIPVNYSTSDGSQTTGLSFRVHYDSSLFSFDPSTGISNQAQADLFQIGSVQQDTQDLDGDASTDRFIPINIASFSGIFPTGGQPTKLIDLTFKAADLPYDPVTGLRNSTINFSEQETAEGYGFTSTSATLIPLAFNLDVDGDGKVTALGDGLMIIRKMFGSAFAGDALTNKAISPNATRTSAEIHQYIENGINNGFLDVDKDGKTTALGDGLMVIRHLFGPAFSGDALISKAISPDSPYFGNMDASSSVAGNIDALRPLIA